MIILSEQIFFNINELPKQHLQASKRNNKWQVNRGRAVICVHACVLPLRTCICTLIIKIRKTLFGAFLISASFFNQFRSFFGCQKIAVFLSQLLPAAERPRQSHMHMDACMHVCMPLCYLFAIQSALIKRRLCWRWLGRGCAANPAQILAIYADSPRSYFTFICFALCIRTQLRLMLTQLRLSNNFIYLTFFFNFSAINFSHFKGRKHPSSALTVEQ